MGHDVGLSGQARGGNGLFRRRPAKTATQVHPIVVITTNCLAGGAGGRMIPVTRLIQLTHSFHDPLSLWPGPVCGTRLRTGNRAEGSPLISLTDFGVYASLNDGREIVFVREVGCT
jgi:hypothetical protein